MHIEREEDGSLDLTVAQWSSFWLNLDGWSQRKYPLPSDHNFKL